jgi:small ligand-binding sensory domain FIST
MGITKEGALVVGDRVKAGKSQIRFHVRDGVAAKGDLTDQLGRCVHACLRAKGRAGAAKLMLRCPMLTTPTLPCPNPPSYLIERKFSGRYSKPPLCAILFSCQGRGTNLYGPDDPSTDSTTFASAVPVPTAGWFGNGEIGPLGAVLPGGGRDKVKTHMHGFTSVFAMIYDTSGDAEEAEAKGG